MHHGPEILFLQQEGVVMDVADKTQVSGHGWDNTLPNMLAQIRVYGPAFKPAPPPHTSIQHTELFNLFCSLLEVQPSRNSGRLDTWDFLLSSPPDRRGWEEQYEQVPAPCQKK